jgi:photosystem II stability/assembly factor-like uncharacterized protein
VLVTCDSGITWNVCYENQVYDIFEWYTSLFFINPDTGWVGGMLDDWSSWPNKSRFVILKTTDGGLTWSRKEISLPPIEYGYNWKDMIDLYFIDELHGWAIGYADDYMGSGWYYSLLLKTSNGGNTWSRITCELPTEYVWGEGDNLIYCKGDIGYAVEDWRGSFFKSTNGGHLWNLINTGFSSHFKGGYFSDPQNGWVVGSGGTILRTSDGGMNWTREACPTAATLYHIFFTPEGDGWIFGDKSTILHLADSTMVSINEPGNPESNNISVFPNPFTTSTAFEYELQENTIVILKVYNHLGQEVGTLVNEGQDKGNHKVIWDAGSIPSGIYFYRLTAGSRSSTGKMVVVK